MAGGTASGKTSALAATALARIEEAKQALQNIQQCGLLGVADGRHAAKVDPAITAAITALQALQ
jgi:hypothetical protein